jgi:hypothetical protein
MLDVAAALAVIPNDGPANWDYWNHIGMASFRATGGTDTGFSLWCAWSSRHLDFDQEASAERWDHFRRSPPTHIGAGSLFYLARQVRPDWRKPTEANRPSAADEFGRAPLPPEQPERTPDPERGPKSRGRLLWPADYVTTARRDYIVKGFLTPGDLACIFGPPGAGKTVIAPHMGLRLRRVATCFGRRTRPGTVFYVPFEDTDGVRDRAEGLRLTHPGDAKFTVVDGFTNLFDDSQVAELLELVAEHKPSLTFIDTVAMAFDGLRENEGEDMARVVRVSRRLTQHGAAVVLIHHDPKDGNGTPRGHSTLNGALDVSLQLVKADDSGVIIGSLVKNKRGPCHGSFAFKIRSAPVAHDVDGAIVTAPVATEVEADAASKTPKLSNSHAAALDVLREMAARADDGSVDDARWREACCDSDRVSAADTRDGRVKAFKRAKAELVHRQWSVRSTATYSYALPPSFRLSRT